MPLATLHNDQGDLKNCCALTNQRLAALDAGSHEINDWMEEIRKVLGKGFSTMAAVLIERCRGEGPAIPSILPRSLS